MAFKWVRASVAIILGVISIGFGILLFATFPIIGLVMGPMFWFLGLLALGYGVAWAVSRRGFTGGRKARKRVITWTLVVIDLGLIAGIIMVTREALNYAGGFMAYFKEGQFPIYVGIIIAAVLIALSVVARIIRPTK